MRFGIPHPTPQKVGFSKKKWDFSKKVGFFKKVGFSQYPMIFSKFRLSITLRSLGVGWREGDLDLLARSETFVSGVFRTLRWDLGHPTHPKDGSGNDIFLMIFWDFTKIPKIRFLLCFQSQTNLGEKDSPEKNDSDREMVSRPIITLRSFCHRNGNRYHLRQHTDRFVSYFTITTQTNPPNTH